MRPLLKCFLQRSYYTFYMNETTKRFFSDVSLNIFSLELGLWPYEIHRHNFYELIFIRKGKGKHIVNDIEIPYAEGDIFLLTHNDEHFFNIEEKTTFTFLKFTEQLLSEKTENKLNNRWHKAVEHILFNINVRPDRILSDEKEKKKAFQLLDLLYTEYKIHDRFSRLLVLELFGSMMILISRDLSKRSGVNSLNRIYMDKVSQILSYIRQHILDREKVSVQAIANRFYMSPNYVSIFIKKHAGVSLQKMILKTRLKTADRMLTDSDLTISEIAIRLDFTDSSHFTKIFKKYRGGYTPKNFRKIYASGKTIFLNDSNCNRPLQNT